MEKSNTRLEQNGLTVMRKMQRTQYKSSSKKSKLLNMKTEIQTIVTCETNTGTGRELCILFKVTIRFVQDYEF
jgi:hypothetical protein